MKNKNKHFRTQIIYIFLVTFISLFLVNVFIFRNMRHMIDDVDRAYEGNRNLTEMREWLDNIHSRMNEYLNTKDEQALNQFYQYEENYKAYLKEFDYSDDMSLIQIRQRGVYNLSNSYIQSANMAVIAKNGNDVERYQTYRERAQEQYRYLTTYMNDLNNQMFYANSDTHRTIFRTSRYSELFYVFILILMGGVDICILLLLTRRLVEPLQELAEAAKELGSGNLDIEPIKSSDYNEIGIVSNAFNQMVVSLKDYIEKFRRSVEAESILREKSIQMEASVKDAQLKYLQAQINPHFLFNTLNAGAQLAMMENADRTYRYIHKVADFFRFKIKNDDSITTVAEELQIVDDYIYILNVRYSGDIHYEKEVDEKLLSCRIPSMVLQPLVENSIKHGFKEVEWEKQIVISVATEEEDVVISVRDNGVGIPEEVAKGLLNNTWKPSAEEGRIGGVGLDNVIARLRTFYNREDVIEITSVGKNMGTEIALYLPRDAKGE